MTITPIEESFALLNRYGLVYSSTDSEQVDGLTYAWRKLKDQVSLHSRKYDRHTQLKHVEKISPKTNR